MCVHQEYVHVEYVCMCVGVIVWMDGSMYICVHICVYVYMYVSV